MPIYKQLFILFLCISTAQFSAATDDLELQEVTENVYAIVGSLGNRTPDNLGNNATFGFVVTSEGVVVIDSGGTHKGAKRLHEVIKRVTDKPIVTVINTGGQDHRWLGNEYFQKLGAKVIASERAVSDQKARRQDQFIMLGNLVGDEGLSGTNDTYADEVFDNEMQIVVGESTFELYHVGQAHTPGDSFVWLPEQKVMFTGDIVYVERMLGIGEQSNSKSWVKVYESMASFQLKYIVPGHGHPTTLQQANSDTYEYLLFLRKSVADFIDNGGDITEIRRIDQSQYEHLRNFELLSGLNAQNVYTELEWE